MVTKISDSNIMDNILNIGRRRERVIYYRPDGTPTCPLPADAYSQLYYMRKGFTMKPPEVEVKKDIADGIPCPLCEFKAKDAFGLSVHLRKHTKESEKEEK